MPGRSPSAPPRGARRGSRAGRPTLLLKVLDPRFFVRDRPDRTSPRATKKAGGFPARKDQPGVVNVTRRIQLHCLQRPRPWSKGGVEVACTPYTTQALASASIPSDQQSSPNEEAQNVATFLTRLARVGRIVEQPPFWGGVATALAVKGGTRGRLAALRGSVCYVVAAFIANIVIKPLVYRRRPQGAGEGRISPVTSSFPSGHTASDSAFVFGVAQELPLLAIPLAAAATAAHWSLIRSDKHHVSDVLAGGAIGLGVAYIIRKSWPTDTSPLVR